MQTCAINCLRTSSERTMCNIILALNGERLVLSAFFAKNNRIPELVAPSSQLINFSAWDFLKVSQNSPVISLVQKQRMIRRAPCLSLKQPHTDLLRNIELTSSWVIGGFLLLAAMRSGRRKTDTRADSCLTYSSSHSTKLNTIEFRFRMLSAWSDRMYNSTICFQRRRHSHPRKKLCTC